MNKVNYKKETYNAHYQRLNNSRKRQHDREKVILGQIKKEIVDRRLLHFTNINLLLTVFSWFIPINSHLTIRFFGIILLLISIYLICNPKIKYKAKIVSEFFLTAILICFQYLNLFAFNLTLIYVTTSISLFIIAKGLTLLITKKPNKGSDNHQG